VAQNVSQDVLHRVTVSLLTETEPLERESAEERVRRSEGKPEVGGRRGEERERERRKEREKEG